MSVKTEDAQMVELERIGARLQVAIERIDNEIEYHQNRRFAFQSTIDAKVTELNTYRAAMVDMLQINDQLIQMRKERDY